MTKKDRGTIFAVALITPLLFSIPSYAQQQCGPTEDVMNVLKKKHKEQVRGVGVYAANTSEGFTSELFVSESGSWTLVTSGRGMSCVKAHGTGWTFIPAEELVTGEGA